MIGYLADLEKCTGSAWFRLTAGQGKDSETMKFRNLGMILGLAIALGGCVSFAPAEAEDVVVQTCARVAVEDPAADKNGAFFLRRSMLCRQAFTEAVTNLVGKTGRDEEALRGVTICGIDEGYTNGVYTLRLDAAWSATREAAANRILSTTNAADAVAYVPSLDESKSLTTWIGPKQVQDVDGKIHFLGISAMAIGRNVVLSQQNIRRAELDAQAMAVRAFLGKGRKMTDVKALFRHVFAMRSRHPLCPNREMYVCGYEVISLDKPAR